MARVKVDDRDPRIDYSAGWHAGGVSSDYNSTTMYTLTKGTTAILTFNGISVTVYGAIASGDSNGTAPQSQYSLDDYDPVVYQANVTSNFQYNQLFYQSPQVPKDQHTLVVTNLINASNSLILDYFVVLTGDDKTASPRQRSSIVAGSLGGIIGCILIILGVFFFLRRRRRKLDETVDSSVVLGAWSGSAPAILNPPYSGPSKFTSPPASTTTDPLTPGITLTGFSSPSTSKPDLPPPKYSLT